MVMEKKAMPNDMAKRGVATGANIGARRPFSFSSQPSPRGCRHRVLRRQGSDGLRQDVMDQVARRLGFVQRLQPVHSGPGFLNHGAAGGAALLVRLEGRQRRALQRAVQSFGQKGLDLDALHSGLGFPCHHLACL